MKLLTMADSESKIYRKMKRSNEPMNINCAYLKFFANLNNKYTINKR
jgi:hypothetical protein